MPQFNHTYRQIYWNMKDKWIIVRILTISRLKKGYSEFRKRRICLAYFAQ